MEELRLNNEEAQRRLEEAQRRQPREAARKDDQIARDIAKAPELRQLSSQDGTNFSHWIESVKNFLYGFNLDDVVTGALETPYRKMGDQYLPPMIRRQVYSKLISKIDQRLLDRVRHVKQGQVEQLLSELNDIYYKVGSLNRHRLMEQLLNNSLDKHEDLMAYISSVDRLWDRLKACGHSGDETDKVFYLLKQIPDDYGSTIDYLRRENSDWKGCVGALADAIARNPDLPGANSGSSSSKRGGDKAFVVGDTATQPSNEVCRSFRRGHCKWGDDCRFRHLQTEKVQTGKVPGRRRVTCWFCGQQGHGQDKCHQYAKAKESARQQSNHLPQPQVVQPPKPPGGPSAANAAIEAKPNDQDEEWQSLPMHSFVAGATGSNPTAVIEWLIDSGTTEHHAASKEAIAALREIKKTQGRRVKVANGTYETTEGEGKALIPASATGGAPIELTCKITPTFDYNLISEGKLEAAGCEIKKKDGVLTVTFEGSTVLRVKRSPDHMYRLTIPLTCTAEKKESESESRVVRSQDVDEEELWRQAEIKEVSQHEKMKTLGETVSAAKVKRMGFQPVALDWVRAIKVLEDGGTKHKARAVIRGNKMIEGKDYNETYANTPNPAAIRMILAIAAREDMEAKSGDVHTAFLSADIDTELYVYPPPRFNTYPGLQRGVKRDYTTCRRVLKAIYGIPQGPNAFQTKKFYPLLRKFGLRALPDEPSIFVSKNIELILIIWTDDLHLFYKRLFEALARRLWKYLQQHLDLDDWSNLTFTLGIKIIRQRSQRKMFLSQHQKIVKLLEDVQMKDCDPHPIPGTPNVKLTKADLLDEEQGKSAQAKVYRKVVCTANHMSIWTRPDITTAVSKLSRYLKSPGANHMSEMKLLVQYLKNTDSLALCFDCSQVSTAKTGLVAYFDASFADCVDTRRSTIGYVIYLDGCPVSWKSRLHQRVATSSNNSEYSASAEVAREVLYLRKILKGLGEAVPTTPVYTDSNGCMSLVEIAGTTPKNKHVEIEMHFFKELVEHEEAAILKVASADNDADIMTKLLPKTGHLKHTEKMMRKVPDNSPTTETDNPAGKNPPLTTSVAATVTRANKELLFRTHRALGHRNFNDVARILGMSLPATKLFCRDCVENKSTRHAMGNGDPGTMKAPRAGHTTDTDMAGPFSTPTKGGNRYLSTLVDRDTKKIDGKMVASQGEFFDHYTEFVKMAEAHFGKPNIFSILHSDSATYYKDSARLRQFCAKKGIRQTFSPPYTQALNAIAERCIRTIVEMARTSLNASGLQIVYYGEALMYAITVLNNLPQKKNKGWTPEELWQGRKHSYPIHTKLKPFGCAAWVLNLRQSRRKFDQKSELQICLNYNPNSHAYRLLSIPQGRISESAHVAFNVDYFPMAEKNTKTGSNDWAPQYSIDSHDYDSPLQEHERPTRDRTPSAQALRNLAAK